MSDLDDVKSIIPHREPFLFVDRIIEQGESRIVTERTVRADEPHFQGHYPGSPLMPGVLLCEACFQTGAMLLSGVDILSAPVLRASRPQSVQIRWRGRLPHWEAEEGTYFVTWRLADSVPNEVSEAIRAEREDIVKTAEHLKRTLTDSEMDRLEQLHTVRLEELLNAGHGACYMKDDRCARVVADALLHFDGERYDLHAWSVMPNHVHVVFQAKAGQGLAQIVHAWKSLTAKECNRVLGRSGTFWMDESFDRLVRDETEFNRYVDYTLRNPAAAGLEDWPWVGCAGETPASQKAAGETPATPPATPRKPVLTRILEAKFRGMVRPGDSLHIEVEQEEKMGDAHVMNGKVSVAGKNVLRVKFIVALIEA
ncbi:MAG: transposase [Planctomycetes bacterium]|nr:transposase [Planctomycetota bacterium]